MWTELKHHYHPLAINNILLIANDLGWPWSHPSSCGRTLHRKLNQINSFIINLYFEQQHLYVFGNSTRCCFSTWYSHSEPYKKSICSNFSGQPIETSQVFMSKGAKNPFLLLPSRLAQFISELHVHMISRWNTNPWSWWSSYLGLGVQIRDMGSVNILYR